jgi:hypothetical protein
VGQPSDIDRLIEEGLDRYGSGDLDGALIAWEEALAIDPENAQANSYIDYVRMNYEILSTDAGPSTSDDGSPFAIEEEPEYHIEIVSGELEAAASGSFQIDQVDAGWFTDEATRENPPVEGSGSNLPQPTELVLDDSAPGMTFELEADEPPESEPPPPPVEHPPRASSPAIVFESETREYANRDSILGSEFSAEPPTTDFIHEQTPTEFPAEGTPVGFGAQTTSVKERDLGFVQPTAGRASTSPGLGASGVTPAGEVPKPVTDKPSSPMTIGTAPTMELGAAGLAKPPADNAPAVPTRTDTKPLPGSNRVPAAKTAEHVSQAEVALPHLTTRDLSRVPTQPLGNKLAPVEEPAIGAPTRDLGLRPAGKPPRAPTDTDDDAPTRESDARQIRELAAARARARHERPATDSTRHDIELPFDPIEQRAAQILDDVDADVPPGESDEDRTRRRITNLFTRAVEWNGIDETEKAVIAVDLALAEDPETALAQKLIHRNREAILGVFQSYLGDLERQPQLTRPLHELAGTAINPRAAFLLSRIDGTLTIDEILDVSGMPRMEAYRHLCQLFLRGVLK